MSEIIERIMELEIRSAHQEDTIEQLNQIVIKQQLTIDNMVNHIDRLKTQISNLQESAGKEAPEPPPPHY